LKNKIQQFFLKKNRIAKLDVTTKEILECCKDLRVLGRKEFRNLMKWRTMVRKILKKVIFFILFYFLIGS